MSTDGSPTILRPGRWLLRQRVAAFEVFSRRYRMSQAGRKRTVVALIKNCKPLERSTGPRTPEGKTKTSRNADKGDTRGMLRAIGHREIASRYVVWEIVGPPEYRVPRGGTFNPWK